MDGVVLHTKTKQNFERLTANLPHALVIEGPSGTGVRTVAELLARSMASPILVIEPKKMVNSQPVVDMKEGNIIIDDIRLLYEQTRSKQPGNQVYVLDTGERSMTISAQNAFLKLLEEPRHGLYFIIATHQYDQLLPTIVSRSQRLPLLSISTEQTLQLIESLRIEDATKKARLAFVGRGLPALIKRLADDTKLYESRVAIMGDAKSMIGGSGFEKAGVIHRYRDNRADAVTLLDDMNHQLSVIVKSNPDPSYVALIARNLETRNKVLAGGNIRLQLLNGVL